MILEGCSMNGIEKRRYGTNPSLETRAEAKETVDVSKRYRQIVEILEDFKRPMSAKEIAIEMYKRGYIPTPERNFSHPRINELLEKGVLDKYGKGTCKYTHKKVTFYTLWEKYDKERFRRKP